MSTIILATVLLAGIVASYFLIFYAGIRRSRKRLHHFLNRFSKLGSYYSLSFTSQEILTDCLIGLDGRSRKILVFHDRQHKAFNHYLLNLDQVRACEVGYYYQILDHGGAYELYEKKEVDGIFLCFHFDNPDDRIEVEFYRKGKDRMLLLAEREQKARDWETIISKMLKRPVERGLKVV
jgi:hypothetical protein